MRIPVFGFIACVAISNAASAQTLPQQKPGLWQQTVTFGNSKISDQMCLDAASEAKFSALGSQLANKKCKATPVTHNPDGSWSLVSTCEILSGWTTTSHIVVTGDFNSRYHTVIESVTTGAPVATLNGKHRSVVEASWTGPCKPGQKGGDIIMGNGAKTSVIHQTGAPR
jgi:hypothetical protein